MGPSPQRAASAAPSASGHRSQRSSLPAAETASAWSTSTTTPPPLPATAPPCVFNVYIGDTGEAQVVGGELWYEARNNSTSSDDNTCFDEEKEEDDDGSNSSRDAGGDSIGAKLCQLLSWFEATLHLFGWDLDTEAD